ncbi:hypothetical protein AB1207_24335 [Kineococcus endophyticus]|uniref:Uncharacterized protein n=1 Tax=Kineococcus endophyticus TaxID=1181883 RepID=A0ABV3PE09_9ACTN
MKKIGELSEEAKLLLPGDPIRARVVSDLDLHKVGELIGWSQLSRSGEMSSIYNLHGVENAILEEIYSNTGYTLGVEHDPIGDSFSSADKGAGALTETFYYLLLGVDGDDLKIRSLPITRVAKLYSEWGSQFYRHKRTQLTFTRWAASS